MNRPKVNDEFINSLITCLKQSSREERIIRYAKQFQTQVIEFQAGVNTIRIYIEPSFEYNLMFKFNPNNDNKYYEFDISQEQTNLIIDYYFNKHE